MSQGTTPPARRAQRPPRINVNNLQSNGSAMGSMPPTAQTQAPCTAQTNTSMPTMAAGQPYWPQYANPFAPGNFMVKGFEGFVDFTKSGMSFGEKFTYGLYDKFSKWSKKWFTHMFLFIVVALYSIGGALLFGVIEGRRAAQEAMDIHALQKDFFRAMHDLSQDHELREYSTAEFNGKVVYTLRAHQAALDTLLNNNETLEELEKQREPWSFWNAMFYCGTIYTTIGYGHITPKTTLGQSLTIVYAIVGIPMFLILLADFGKLFTRGMKFLWAYVRRLYYTGTCRKIRKQQQVRDAMSGFNTVYNMATRRPSYFFGVGVPAAEADVESQAASEVAKSLGAVSHPDTPTTPYPETFEVDDEFNLPVSVATSLLIAYILIGAFVYTLWEDWTYFEAFYFVFVSMSTIGFGDFVPNHPIFMMCSIIYLIFGLALTSMFINVVQIKLSDTFKQASAKIGATIGLGVPSEIGDEQIKTPSDIPSVHGSRLCKIAEKNIESPASPTQHLTSILRPSRPILPPNDSQEDPSDVEPEIPPLLPRTNASGDQRQVEKNKRKQFFK